MSEIDFLKVLDRGDIEMFETIDDDGIRKSAVQATKIPNSFVDPAHDISYIHLRVDWRLLEKWQNEEEEDE